MLMYTRIMSMLAAVMLVRLIGSHIMLMPTLTPTTNVCHHHYYILLVKQ